MADGLRMTRGWRRPCASRRGCDSQAAAPPPAPESKPKAFNKAGILDLLNNFVPSSRVADLVKQYGLRFNPSEADFQDIRDAGGKDELIAALREAAKPQK